MNDLIDYTAIVKLKRTNLGELIQTRRGLKEKMDALRETLDAVNDKLAVLLIKAEVKTVGVEGTRVTLLEGGPREKLDKKKLWQKLVDMGVEVRKVKKAFSYATSETMAKASVRVTEPKEEK
jgi:hypothetical protein